MGEDYKRIEAKKYAKYERVGKREDRSWGKLKFPVTVKEFSPITCLDFSPVKPYDFAVTCASKVDIYSSVTNQIKKSITKVKDNVASGHFRKDGKLIVAGGDDKVVKVYDADSKSLLRQFSGHTNSVHYTAFTFEGTSIVSGSDDTTIKLWDLATEKEVFTCKGHEDYVRTGALGHSNPYLLASGSYDHTVKLWDTRSKSLTMSLHHEHPVESVVLFPAGGICISAGSNVIKVWDVLGGGKMMSSFSNHAKTVTSLCLNSTFTRLFAGSLDRDVKVYDVKDYAVVATLEYPSPILSVAVSPSQSHVVVGMVDGLLSIREKQQKTVDPDSGRSGLPLPAVQKGQRYFKRAEDDGPGKNDFVVHYERGPRKSLIDRLLLRFEHRRALDEVISRKSAQPGYVISVIRELSRRDNLQNSLSGKDEHRLCALLKFVNRYITDPRFSGILIEVANIVLDIYVPEIGRSPSVDRHFETLRKNLRKELDFQRTAVQIVGALDTLVAVSSIHQTPT